MGDKESLVLDPTDERMVPESAGMGTFWEHVYRYAFACRFVGGKRVLDIACGEGYGSAALQKTGAANVIGVDVSESTCVHVRNKYGLDAKPGTAEQIPLPDNSIDVVVSFETIEHVPDPGRFLDECVRVLAPGGMLVISTPNKEVYSGRLGTRNRYHCSEMTEEEFASALRALSRFPFLYPASRLRGLVESADARLRQHSMGTYTRVPASAPSRSKADFPRGHQRAYGRAKSVRS